MKKSRAIDRPALRVFSMFLTDDYLFESVRVSVSL